MKVTLRIKQFIRGGQTFLHDLHMFGQLLWKLVRLAPLLITGAMVVWWCVGVGSNDKQFVMNTVKQEWYSVIPAKKHLAKPMSVYQQSQVDRFKENLYQALGWSGVGYMTIMILIVLWLKRYGRVSAKNNVLRGAYLASLQECQKRLKQTKLASDIALGCLPLVKDSETAHLLIHGTTGTGKSVCLYELLDAIRRRGERAIVYDKSGGFFSHYYHEDQDKLLNPLDNRSQCWDLWTECRNRSDFDTLATALIPLPPGSNDPFWINAARTLFAVTAFQLRENPQRSAKLLMEYLLSRNLVSLQQLIKGTEGEVLVCDDIAKVALSIKSVLAASLKSLAFLNETQQPFSIRDWVEDEKETGWLFVTSRADHHVTLTPLISSWLDLVSNALMSLPPSPKRRIWLCLDELASLQQLPSLMSMLAESRKFGGCVAMTLQNIAQLHSIYGKSGADALADLCSTRIFFRSPSATVAQWVSKELGESEFIEVREGISYGAHLSRDGVSMAKQRVTTSVVMATEIEQLPNLQAYVRLPGIVTDNKITTWPVTKIEFVPQCRAMPVAAFEAKTEMAEETVAEEAPIQESVENKILNETVFYPIDITDVVSRLKKVKGDKKCSQ